MMRRKGRSCRVAWWIWIGCAISVDHCMSSSTIALMSSLLPISSRFAAIYDADDYKSEIDLMDLAKAKLLDGPIVLEAINRAGSLAWLSVRFALEFYMDVTAGIVALTQVERHMRLCISATTEILSIVTNYGAEP